MCSRLGFLSCLKHQLSLFRPTCECDYRIIGDEGLPPNVHGGQLTITNERSYVLCGQAELKAGLGQGNEQWIRGPAGHEPRIDKMGEFAIRLEAVESEKRDSRLCLRGFLEGPTISPIDRLVPLWL